MAAEPASRMKRKVYEKELKKLQVELCHLQEWVKANKARVIILFEGRDAAGKGGTIKAIAEKVSPRVFRVVALPAPSDREKSQLFIQRYMQHFPAAGEIAIFDRSWYNRAGVEHVMGFVTPADHKRFLSLCPQMEQHIIDGGIILIKLWLEVGMEEQERRFKARIDDPLRQWKLSPMDTESYRRWYDYSRARDFDVQGYQLETCAMAHHPFRRQATGAAELYLASLELDAVQAGAPRQGEAAEAFQQRTLQ
jgi:polyphosphate kinase 2